METILVVMITAIAGGVLVSWLPGPKTPAE